jgi:alpha-tubulin suppressor-like RCC1 family protein
MLFCHDSSTLKAQPVFSFSAFSVSVFSLAAPRQDLLAPAEANAHAANFMAHSCNASLGRRVARFFFSPARHPTVLISALFILCTPMLNGALPGTLVAWGDNSRGQITIPADLNGVMAVSAGAYHTMALKSNGAVVVWGWNVAGQTNVPNNLSGVAAISSGYHHCVSLKSDGTVVAWGHNGSGQTNVPAGLSSVKAIDAGEFFTMVLKNDGTVVAWGDNGFLQTNVPAGLNGVTAITAGYSHAAVLKADGTVASWGFGAFGLTNVPVDLNGVAAIASGAYHTVALKSNGTVVAWGFGQAGQTSVPIGLSGVAAIAAGATETVALKSNGTLVAWGSSQYVPPDLNGVTSVTTGGGPGHTVALIGFVSPRLAIQPNGNSVILSWPDTAIDYRAESCANLSSPLTWVNIVGSFQTNSGSINISLPATEAKAFYRLVKP